MGWFREKIDPHTGGLVKGLTDAYVERAQLYFQLLTLDPQLSDIEMAVLWAGGASIMHRAAVGA